jgi:hypothetical protein
MPFPMGVNAPRLLPPDFVPLALVALVGLAQPVRLISQDEHKGKIDDVERSAENAKKQGSEESDDGGGGFLYGLLRLFFHVAAHTRPVTGDTLVEPEQPGQGYLAYPWAMPLGPDRFVLRNVTTGREFGTFSASYFIDDQSTLRAGHFSLEGAYDFADVSLEYSLYREPKPGETDYLHLFRIGVAALPRLGDLGYLKVGFAAQGLLLDNGDAAGGPEVELGVQLFPVRPAGLGASARFAPMTWRGGPAFGTGFADLMGNASLFLGRVELQAGYRWTRVGVGAPFRGPTLGMRVWF